MQAWEKHVCEENKPLPLWGGKGVAACLTDQERGGATATLVFWSPAAMAMMVETSAEAAADEVYKEANKEKVKTFGNEGNGDKIKLRNP